MKNCLLREKNIITIATLLFAVAVIMMCFHLHDFAVNVNSNQKNIEVERLKDMTFQGAFYVKNVIKIYVEHIQSIADKLAKFDCLNSDILKDYIKDINKGTQFHLIAVDILSEDRYFSNGEIEEIVDFSYIEELEKKGSIVSDVIKSNSGNNKLIELICPISKKDGPVVGAVRGFLYVGALGRTLNHMLFEGDGYCSLFDGNGEYLSFSEDNVLMYQENHFNLIEKFTFDDGYSLEQLKNDASNRRPYFTEYSFKNEQKCAYSMPVDVNKWYFSMIVPKWVIDRNSKEMEQKAFYMVIQTALMLFMLVAVFIFVLKLLKLMMLEISKNHEEALIDEKRFNLILKRSENILFEYTMADASLKFSDKFEKLFQRKPIENGLPLKGIESGNIHPESVATLLRLNDDIKKGLPAVSGELRLIDGSGKYIWCFISSDTIFNEKNVPVKSLGTIEIINDKKEMEYKYNEIQKYKRTIDSDNIFICDINLTKNLYISGYEEILSKTNIVSDNNYLNILRLIARDYFHVDNMNDLMLKNNPNNLISLFFYGATDPAFEYRTSENGKADKWLYFRYKFYESPETKDICAIVSIMDISEQKRKEAELIDKAERDQMTGLYNKTTTEKLINEWLHNYESSFGALMMIDIDNFKNVNDKLGHLYGDMMLKKIAEALKAAFRSNDVVGRIGGDEFFVFLKKLYSEKHISDKAKEICKLFHNVFEEKGISCEISASIGVALYPKHGDTLNELYRNADTALYLSKEKGKNNFTIYNGESFRGYALITEIDS